MKQALSMIILGLSLITFSLVEGCSAYGERIADKVGDAIEIYCREPYMARSVVRDTVNTRLAQQGHRVQVNCAGDPEPQTKLEDLELEAMQQLPLYVRNVPAYRRYKPEI